MSKTTKNLGLFEYEKDKDGASTFNIKQALNGNWDKLDNEVAARVKTAELAAEVKKVVKDGSLTAADLGAEKAGATAALEKKVDALGAGDVGADPTGTAANEVSTHNTSESAHSALFAAKQDKITGKKGQFVGFTADNVPGAVDAPSGGVNPNLLDNWYFGNPVNQRGLTELSSGNWDMYFIDRWLATGPERVYAITDDGIKISNLQHKYYQIWNQELERVEKRTYTLSFLLKNIGLLSMTFTPQGADYTEQTLDGGFIVSFTSKANLTKPVIRLLESTSVTVSDVTLLAAKLELGDTQTLAHKENGVWVLNEIPDFGEQLRRCQRYAVDDNYHTTVGQLNYDGDTYYISVQFPCVMRTTPVITLKEISAIGWGLLPISNAEITWYGANGFFVAIKDLSNMNNFIGKACTVTYFASADL